MLNTTLRSHKVMNHTYTVEEIEELRKLERNRLESGFFNPSHIDMRPRVINMSQTDINSIIESRVRTYIQAGVKPSDLISMDDKIGVTYSSPLPEGMKES